jgi:hypothetical protein
MKKLVDYTQLELELELRASKEWKAIAFIAIIAVFGLTYWISELIYQRDSALIESANYKAISEKQKEYFSTKIDTMVFYNECGIRINLKENE